VFCPHCKNDLREIGENMGRGIIWHCDKCNADITIQTKLYFNWDDDED